MTTDNPFIRVINEDDPIDDIHPLLHYPYELSNFQKHALHTIYSGANLLLTAHTGSGKTVPAQNAILHTVRKNQRVIYTSPIKCLSNQKYRDFINDFKDYPEVSIGIITGDNKIAPDANVLIVTEEILTNALYDLTTDPTKVNITSNLGCVIKDEVHFLNDESRGTVWEQGLVLLNRNVQLVLLSATMKNAYQFASWIGRIKQHPIHWIPTTRRVVPLNHYIYYDNNIYQIKNEEEYVADGYIRIQKHKKTLLESQQASKSVSTNMNTGSSLGMITSCILFLKKEKMLPAMFFCFSRKNCEKYAELCKSINLLTVEEQVNIEHVFDYQMRNYKKDYEKLNQYNIMKLLICKGIAFHHAGVISVLREVVEIIYSMGLIKILICTETCAVGINMPAKTVIFSELEKSVKYNKRRFLTTAEYTQMSGRAGRRGIDTIGHCIILPLHEFYTEPTVKSVLFGNMLSVTSKFKIDYNFVLKVFQSNISLTTFINNSLSGIENETIIMSQERQIQEITDKCNDIVNEMNMAGITEVELKEFKELQTAMACSELASNPLGILVKLSSSQQKKIHNLKKKVDSVKYNLYSDKMKYEKLLEVKQQELTNSVQVYENQFNLIVTYLKRLDYISDDDKTTVKGIMGALINDCNPIIFVEMITERIFDELTPEEIAMHLAIFIGDHDEDDLHDNIRINPRIKTMINELSQLEQHCGINYLDGEWDLNYNYVNITNDWVNGIEIGMIVDKYGVFEGNFVRNMLKLSNIVTNMTTLCQTCNKIELLPKLEKINTLIIRDVVNINSLYING